MPPLPRLPRLPTLTSLREYLSSTLAFAALTVTLLVAAYWVLDPSPPRRVTLATGVDQGAYAEFGRRYAALLQRHGIEVVLRPTDGAAANLALLRDADSGVELAFVQGGADERSRAEATESDEGLVSLGSMFYEPVWLFYREDSARRLLQGGSRTGASSGTTGVAGRANAPARAAEDATPPRLTSLSQLAGWKVNVGAPGSGVPPLMAQLLDANRVEASALSLSQLPTTPAVVEFLEGRLDALVMASAPESVMVQMLLQTPGVVLFDFAQAEAYSRRFPFMSPVVLPRGVVDLSADRPAADVRLVAPTATLVARESLHPALAQLFVQAATQVHGDAGWFQRKGQFPNASNTERPLDPEAQRFYRSGVPWMQRYLPFWLANLVDRMWVVLISLVAVLLPLSRVLPPLVEMRIRSRVFRWYAQLRNVEIGRGQRPIEELMQELDEIDERVNRISVPLSYADELYALRSHIQLVRRRLESPLPAEGAAT